MSVRAYGEWVVVKADPRIPVTSGGIHLPDDITLVERKMHGTGIIQSIGSRVREALGYPLEPGMRICYRGFLKDAHKVSEEEGQLVFVLHCEDILAEIDSNANVGEL